MRSRSEEKSETWESSETVDRPSPLVATVPPWPGSLVFLKFNISDFSQGEYLNDLMFYSSTTVCIL